MGDQAFPDPGSGYSITLEVVLKPHLTPNEEEWGRS
jgi:hypothetical protein